MHHVNRAPMPRISKFFFLEHTENVPRIPSPPESALCIRSGITAYNEQIMDNNVTSLRAKGHNDSEDPGREEGVKNYATCNTLSFMEEPSQNYGWNDQ